ncbi:MAG TPA: hypothetical protein IGS53_24295 [Leptolyngbyaceae cyanobacterium M33_DOE_097]|uniref:Uncharacterized protein n=1 Tax=Oscillatoriales cyanobacterium SpSt-418 TaxID=2282169 RepID=A0A7C3KIX2_9CYAN|nr:hypothetical protein [Leptolyngbyaceae cyanobacterium M33_DOE_097]
MNTQLVNSIIQVIFSLSEEEQALIREKLLLSYSESSTSELVRLAETGGAFHFLEQEPDLYTVTDGEPLP